jgi:hypothetical protein
MVMYIINLYNMYIPKSYLVFGNKSCGHRLTRKYLHTYDILLIDDRKFSAIFLFIYN